MEGLRKTAYWAYILQLLDLPQETSPTLQQVVAHNNSLPEPWHDMEGHLEEEEWIEDESEFYQETLDRVRSLIEGMTESH